MLTRHLNIALNCIAIRFQMRNLFYDYITQGSRLNKCKDHYMQFSLLFACGEMQSKGELEIVEITLKTLVGI